MEAEEKVEALLKSLSEGSDQLIQGTLSNPFESSSSVSKITFRRLKDYIQVTEYNGSKAIHQNFDLQQFTSFLREKLVMYKQAMLFTVNGDFQLLTSKKGKKTLVCKKPTRALESQAHNRVKNYVIPEGEPIPFLVELGVMNEQGKVFAKKRDKFLQVNRFLEIVSDCLSALPSDEEVHIVDFGCGKATLTFGLYAFLTERLGKRVHVYGIDQRRDVIEFCENVKEKLKFDQIYFDSCSIEQFYTKKPVSMVVALHACDTATDMALAKALEWNAAIILSVPCCQHELLSQVDHPDLKPILRHGLLKERFSAIVTDAARGEILELMGYQTQMVEFIDKDHTAKNLLIRAVKRNNKQTELSTPFQAVLNIKPSLLKYIK